MMKHDTTLKVAPCGRSENSFLGNCSFGEKMSYYNDRPMVTRNGQCSFIVLLVVIAESLRANVFFWIHYLKVE